MRRKKCSNLSMIFFVLFIAQLFALNHVSKLYVEFENNHAKIEENYIDINSTLINDTVREQQRNNLSSIKQSWISYLEVQDINLIKRDADTYPIYSNGINSITYDDKTMTKEKKELNKFDIYNKEGNSILISNATPQWDESQVEEILNMLVKPLKMFGNNGGFIVFDSYSGKIFLDTTKNQRLANDTEVFLCDDKVSADNKNTTETEKTIDNYFMFRKDSNRINSIVYMFNEKTKMGDQVNNFELYKLGDYNRQFVEMSVLPYETIGFDGQLMQLTILSVVDEEDISSSYVNIMKDMDKSIVTNKNIYGQVSIALIISLIATMISSLIVLYSLKIKNNINE